MDRHYGRNDNYGHQQWRRRDYGGNGQYARGRDNYDRNGNWNRGRYHDNDQQHRGWDHRDGRGREREREREREYYAQERPRRQERSRSRERTLRQDAIPEIPRISRTAIEGIKVFGFNAGYRGAELDAYVRQKCSEWMDMEMGDRAVMQNIHGFEAMQPEQQDVVRSRYQAGSLPGMTPRPTPHPTPALQPVMAAMHATPMVDTTAASQQQLMSAQQQRVSVASTPASSGGGPIMPVRSPATGDINVSAALQQIGDRLTTMEQRQRDQERRQRPADQGQRGEQHAQARHSPGETRRDKLARLLATRWLPLLEDRVLQLEWLPRLTLPNRPTTRLRALQSDLELDDRRHLYRDIAGSLADSVEEALLNAPGDQRWPNTLCEVARLLPIQANLLQRVEGGMHGQRPRPEQQQQPEQQRRQQPPPRRGRAQQDQQQQHGEAGPQQQQQHGGRVVQRRVRWEEPPQPRSPEAQVADVESPQQEEAGQADNQQRQQQQEARGGRRLGGGAEQPVDLELEGEPTGHVPEAPARRRAAVVAARRLAAGTA